MSCFTLLVSTILAMIQVPDRFVEVAMRDHLSSFQKRTGLQLTFNARRVPREVPRPIAGSLYRIVQESLNNIARHANATHVVVKLKRGFLGNRSLCSG